MTSDADLAIAVDQMRTLNRTASEILVAHGATAATDVTGFGLLGHALEMARASNTSFVFDASALPVLPGAKELAQAGVETGGAAHNRRFVASSLTVADGVTREALSLAHDPQTSGGLLAAIPAESVEATEAALRASNVDAYRVGAVTEAERPTVVLR
jgi:selenide,water dikinase